ncbi:MAG: metal-dependent transcriptional regulator [Clostridiales bacterium]|jgi:DtxR family Mn-dependent transcriptional regulator|nr:metal-dependent transcriptional regulator [Clostridiales bacterium]
MFNEGTLTPAKEDYLRALLMLSKNDGVRTSDIADHLGVSKPSVSNMMNVLMAEGFVSKKKYGRIYLTEYGRDAAEYVKKNMMC